jgi:hypothetical protein
MGQGAGGLNVGGLGLDLRGFLGCLNMEIGKDDDDDDAKMQRWRSRRGGVV